MKRLILLCLGLQFCLSLGATHFLDIRVVDREYLMLHFRDGEVHYRDDGTGAAQDLDGGLTKVPLVPDGLLKRAVRC